MHNTSGNGPGIGYLRPILRKMRTFGDGCVSVEQLSQHLSDVGVDFAEHQSHAACLFMHNECLGVALTGHFAADYRKRNIDDGVEVDRGFPDIDQHTAQADIAGFAFDFPDEAIV